MSPKELGETPKVESKKSSNNPFKGVNRAPRLESEEPALLVKQICVSEGQTSPQCKAPCAAGRFGEVHTVRESDACDDACDEGYFCEEGSSSPRQWACPMGRFGSQRGMTSSECSGLCAAGRFGSVRLVATLGERAFHDGLVTLPRPISSGSGPVQRTLQWSVRSGALRC